MFIFKKQIEIKKRAALKAIIILFFWAFSLCYAYLGGRFVEQQVHQTVLTKIADLNLCLKELGN